MERKEALQSLLAKVGAGRATEKDFLHACHALKGFHGRLQEAYEEGEMTGAQVAHEELLPDWDYDVSSTGGTDGRASTKLEVKGDPADAEWIWSVDECPVRAWVIAIIKALIAQEETA